MKNKIKEEKMKKWVVVGMFFVLGSVLGWADVPKFTLSITDQGLGVLPWVRNILVYSYDPETKTRSPEPVARVEAPCSFATYFPALTVKLLLPKGQYEVVIEGVSSDFAPVFLSLGYIDLTQDTLLDMSRIKAPYELILPL